MCDVQHWQLLSRTLIWILCVKIWHKLCGTYPESSRGLVLVLWLFVCSLSGVAGAGGTWSVTGSRDEAWEKLRSGDQGHAGRLCEGTVEVKVTMIREGTGLSFTICTGDVRY